MKSTNRTWQNHLKAKGFNNFITDRLKNHVLSSNWQHEKGSFYFPIENRETDDELSRYYLNEAENFPDEFYLEITGRCNLNCKMCARSNMTRQLGTMSNKLFKKIINEIAKNKPNAYVHFYGIGEPTMDKDLFKKLAYMKSKNLTNTILFTNGQNLLECYKSLASAGLAGIGVDLDGFSPGTYSLIRRGGDFNKVKKGILLISDYLKSKKLKTRLEIAYQIYSGINESEIQLFIDWCEKKKLEYKLVTLHSWSGIRKDIPKTKVKGLVDMHRGQRVSPCSMLWSGLFITWNGRVPICFQDADAREIVGDVSTQTIKKIWQGAHRDKRRQHVMGVIKGICKNCDSGTNVKMPQFKSNLYPKILIKKQ